MGKLKYICSRYTEYVLIIGIIIAIVGIVLISLGSPQTREGENPITDEQYFYKVPGPQQELGMKIISAGAVINLLGGFMGRYFLTELEKTPQGIHFHLNKDDKISSNFKWASYISLLFGISLAVFGFFRAINSQEVPTSGGVPIGLFNLAVEQIFGLSFLISGIFIGVSGGYLVGMMLATKGR
ncbi:MAG: hypothetical protein R6W73_04110 [Candidatus Saliniplasma sp.]